MKETCKLTIINLTFTAIIFMGLLIQGESANCSLRLGPWQTKTASPQYHIEGATAVVDNKLYLLGGFGSNELVPTPRVDIYDPSTDTWTRGADAPYGGSHTQGTTTIPWLNQSPHELDRYVWVVAGFMGPHPGQPTDQTWRYDTINDSWIDFVKLPAVRTSGGLALEGSTLHYIGGMRNRNDDVDTHFTYDLERDIGYWENATSFPYARNHFQARAINGKIYMLGGQYHHDDGVEDINVAHSYDIQAQNYTRISDLPFPRSHSEPGTIVVYDWIVQVGGRNIFQSGGNINLDKIFAYDTQNDEFHVLQDLPEKRIGAAAGFFRNISVDGVVGDYIVATCGGIDYDVGATDTWLAQVFLECDDGTQTNSDGWVSDYGTFVPSSAAPSSTSSSDSTTTSGSTSTSFSSTSTSTSTFSDSLDTSSQGFASTNRPQDSSNVGSTATSSNPTSEVDNLGVESSASFITAGLVLSIGVMLI